MKSHANCISSLLLMVVSLGQLASADEPPVARVTMPPIGTAPTIDGVIDEDEWKQAVRNVGLVSQETRSLSLRQGVFWLARDETNVYVAVKTEVASDGRILSRAVPSGDLDVRATFLDDSIELVFDPGPGRGLTDRTCYHIVANARGALYDWAVTFDGQSRSANLAWRAKDLQISQQIVDGWWHVEIAVPLASLGATRQDRHETWGIRVARNWKRPAESADRDERAPLPLVTWDASAPVVRVLSLHENWERPRIELAIANPHEETMAAKVYLSDTWHRDPPRKIVQEVTIAPGHQELIALDGRDGGPEGLHVTEIRVTSLDGNRVDYRRKFTWSMHRTEDPWTVGREQIQAVDLQLKYYPYEGRIRFRANLESLAARQRITGAEARITPNGENGRPATEPLWRRSVVFDQDLTEGTYEIPELPEGKYLFALHLSGGDGVPKEPVTQPFVRQVFPWEHNKLGISDEVMPPFEPLEVDGRQVSAVLRKHIHGPGGLWEIDRTG